ncbi:D-cysteine desulfhydrase family protein [Candidatus Bipolaricaulota bacterium]|nr:D-cysteine desulfhydrase family protein [Candidatus Bipolaricaulota bacterium]
MQIGGIERIRIGTFPTPLQELRNLSDELGGPRLFIKRDDMTGLGLGGNKLRKLEYAFAEARFLGATVIITIGGPQSNHVRLTTAAANKLRLRTILVLRGEEPDVPTGNLLIDRILGASEIHFVGSSGYPSKADVDRIADEKVAEIVDRLKAQGETPYVIPNGCKAIHGALGYSGCVLEVVTQLHAHNLAPNAIVTAIGTSSTHTGLILGSHLYAQGEIDALGISVATATEDLVERIDRQLAEAVAFLGIDRPVPREAIRVIDDYVGPGYGIPTEAMRDAVLRVARTEGIVLDPVYTGKAMAGLIDLIERGRFAKAEVVVFLHTGGVPGLFADAQAATFTDGG